MNNLSSKKFNIFVPGRICLIGEHTDWIINYKNNNKNIKDGRNIVMLLQEGINAEVEKYEKFCLIEKEKIFLIDFDLKSLKDNIFIDNFYSYACAAAYIVKSKFNIPGIKIHIIKNTLPICKGLSSSAAICTLIIKAFNEVYNLKLSLVEIMEYAYNAERLCGSMCGRMDQICCYNEGMYFMHYVPKVEINKIYAKQNMYFVYADLKGEKNTKKILTSLNDIYPVAKNLKEKKAHNFLEKDSYKMVQISRNCIETGNLKKLGKVMNKYQKLFDKKLSCICPSELKAPLLHKFLNDKKIKKYIYGAKGVGSQGDGSIQFLTKNKESQEFLYNYLKKNKIIPYKLTITKKDKVKKAYIALAGKATRMYPYSKFISKEFFPVNYNNKLVPAISVLLEELYDYGIEEIYLGVSSNRQKKFYSDYFKLNKKTSFSEYEEKMNKIFNKLKFIVIKNSTSFADSVSRIMKYSNNEAILFLLGDTIYKSNCEISCTKQLLNEYDITGICTVGIERVKAEDATNYGTCFGNINDVNMIVKKVVEKPKLKYLKKQYNTNYFYRLFGNYVLTPEFFNRLNKYLFLKEKKEKNITPILNDLAKENKLNGLLINGKSYDIGNLESYYNNFKI